MAADMCKCEHLRDVHIMGGACIISHPLFCYCTRFEKVNKKFVDVGNRNIYRF